MEKEFGKLTPEQFRRLVRQLPEVRSQMRELPQLARADPKRLNAILGQQYSWASIYERNFIEQLAYLFVLIGMHEPLFEATKSDDLQQSVIDWMDDNSQLDQWYDRNEDKIDKKHVFWLAVVCQRNILSIMLFHQSMGALVDAVRKGNDEAFFKAVRVDRSVLSCPTFADRLSRAELTNDKTFFLHLRSALKGPSRKHMEALKDLRYAIVMLRELGFDRFTDSQIESLFIKNSLYSKHASAIKNIRKQIQDSRKFSTI